MRNADYGTWREGWLAKRGQPFTEQEIENIFAVAKADLDQCAREVEEIQKGKRKPGTERLPLHSSVLIERIFATVYICKGAS